MIPEEITARALDAIRASGLEQFSSATAYATWLRNLSIAALEGNEVTVTVLTTTEPEEG